MNTYNYLVKIARFSFFKSYPDTISHLLLAMVILLGACNSDHRRTNAKVTGENLQAIARITSGDSVLLTEEVEKDGTFIVREPISRPGFYMLELFEKANSGKKEFLVYLDAEPVHIRFNAFNPKKYPEIFNNTTYQADIQKYYSKLNPLLEAADLEYQQAKIAIGHEIERTSDVVKLASLTEQLKAAEIRRYWVLNDVKLNYIVNNPSSLLSAYLITQSQTELNKNAALYNDLYNNLSAEIKNSEYGVRARLQISKALNRPAGAL